MTDKEIEGICENYFLPLICVPHVRAGEEGTNYGNQLKICIMTKEKKRIQEFSTPTHNLYVNQEIEKQKLLLWLDSIKEILKQKGHKFSS